MNKLTKFIIFLLAISFQLGCSKEESSYDNNSSYEKSIINPDYTSIDWTKTKISEYNIEEGVFTFDNNSETSKIVPGSILTVDLDTMGYIVIVNEVQNNNDKITVKCERGSLCDIFANYDFTLSSSDNMLTRSSNQCDVFVPQKIFVDGKEISEYNNYETRSSSRSIKLTENIWDWENNYDNTVLYSNSYSKIYLKEANLSASLDLNLNLSFGQRSLIKTVNEIYKQYRSKALGIRSTIEGSFSSNHVIKAEFSSNTKIQESEDELWKHNIFPPLRMKFVVQGVPIFITLSADLFRGASLDAEGKISCYAGYRSNATGYVGFDWKQNEGIKPIRGFDMDNTIVYPTVEGKGKVTAQTWLYPRLHLTFYESFGPSFDIKPYLGYEVRGGYKEQALTDSNDYCAWQLKTYNGLDAEVGLSLMFMNYEMEHFDTGKIHILENNLYESPKDIQFYKSQNDTVKEGEKNNVSFMVFDFNHILGKEIETPLPQIVKFEGKGSLSSKYGIAKNGIVSVDWTPQSNQDKLSAILYDYNGKIIKKAVWGNNSNDDNDNGDGTNPTYNPGDVVVVTGDDESD